MCLAVPGLVVRAEESGASRTGRVQFGGISREVCLDLVPEAREGDYVLVHVGFAISTIDEAEAKRTLEILREMGGLEELEPSA